MSELLKRLEMERMQGNFALNNYPNDEYWVNWDELVNVFEEYAQPQLNENQQIVLEFLKGIAVKTDSAPIVTFADFGWQHFGSALPSTVEQAYQSMNGKQDLVVMSAYVNWALEQEEE